jgi:hypothetical protein
MTHSRHQLEELLERAKLMAQAPSITPELIMSYPGLAWVKRYDPATHNYYMLLLSEVYVTTLLGPHVIQYVGKTDFDFWPKKVAAVFYANDEKARLGGKEYKEWVEEPYTSPLTGRQDMFVGVKWSFTANKVLYVAGIGRGGSTCQIVVS